MNREQFERVRSGQGFIAALDQSGGSTPKALRLYGIEEKEYSSEDEMFDLMHAMRSRMIKSPAFTGARVLGAILFEGTMDREIDGVGSAEYLWSAKGVVPFLKVDKGLVDEANGVQVMKPMPELDALLARARAGELAALVPQLRAEAARLGRPVVLEASGVQPEQLKAYGATGIDLISTSAPITRSPWLDLSMRFDPLL